VLSEGTTSAGRDTVWEPYGETAGRARGETPDRRAPAGPCAGGPSDLITENDAACRACESDPDAGLGSLRDNRRRAEQS
jgi:hypothetical protein